MALSEEATKQIVDVLKLEYGTLRTELLQRLATRYQLVSVPLAVLALAVTVGGVQKGPLTAGFMIGALSLLLLSLAAFSYAFLYVGRTIAALSARVAQLEADINWYMQQQYGIEGLLGWETRCQSTRSPWGRLLTGPGVEPSMARRPRLSCRE